MYCCWNGTVTFFTNFASQYSCSDNKSIFQKNIPGHHILV